MSAPTAASSAKPAAAEKESLGALEEDDELEEFPVEGEISVLCLCF